MLWKIAKHYGPELLMLCPFVLFTFLVLLPQTEIDVWRFVMEYLGRLHLYWNVSFGLLVVLVIFRMWQMRFQIVKIEIGWWLARGSFLLLVGMSMLAILIATSYLYIFSEPNLIAEYSAYFMNLDFSIFGTYPSLTLQRYWADTDLELLVLHAYNSIFTIIYWVGVYLVLFHFDNFRKFVMSMVGVFVVALPFWIMFPAISPQQMYLENLLGISIPESIAHYIHNFTASSQTLAYIGFQSDLWMIPGGYAVTTNPSMHAAWGVIVAYWGTKSWKWLGILLIPWSVLNAIGTVYTVQHYAVDTLNGVLLALIVIGFVGWVWRKLSWTEEII